MFLQRPISLSMFLQRAFLCQCFTSAHFFVIVFATGFSLSLFLQRPISLSMFLQRSVSLSMFLQRSVSFTSNSYSHSLSHQIEVHPLSVFLQFLLTAFAFFLRPWRTSLSSASWGCPRLSTKHCYRYRHPTRHQIDIQNNSIVKKNKPTFDQSI